MTAVAEAINTEREHPQDPASAYLYEPPKKSFTSPNQAKIARFKDIIGRALANHPRACVAFSGGSDSLVLLDLVCTKAFTPPATYKPIVIWTDTQMEYPGSRTLKDGQLFYQQRDRIWIVNPLTGWTDAEIQGYIKQHKLEEHPARTRGALTIGCVYCGGGSQYTNSGYRILRKTWPEAWRRLIVEWGAGLVILALKHKRPIDEIREAVNQLGGLQTLAKFQPWLFDFTRKTPQPGYQK